MKKQENQGLENKRAWLAAQVDNYGKKPKKLSCMEARRVMQKLEYRNLSPAEIIDKWNERARQVLRELMEHGRAEIALKSSIEHLKMYDRDVIRKSEVETSGKMEIKFVGFGGTRDGTRGEIRGEIKHGADKKETG